jgi:hypothetical protein
MPKIPGVNHLQAIAGTLSRMRTIDPRNIEVVDDRVAEILRKKTPAERIAMVGECNRTVRSVIAGRLKHEHPTWTEEQIQQEVARRMLGGSN